MGCYDYDCCSHHTLQPADLWDVLELPTISPAEVRHPSLARNSSTSRNPSCLGRYSPCAMHRSISRWKILSLYWNSLPFRGGSILSASAVRCRRRVDARVGYSDSTGDSRGERARQRCLSGDRTQLTTGCSAGTARHTIGRPARAQLGARTHTTRTASFDLLPRGGGRR